MRGVWIGTSGWVYKHWDKSFYPSDWPKPHQFLFYAQHFPTVEINATFYRLPGESMVEGWREKAPDGFVYAVKGSRFITHIKRLKDPPPALEKYFDRIAPLGEHIGPILWQLPPNFERKPENEERVQIFLETLPGRYRHALEFRHPSWIVPETMTALRRFNVANVWLSSSRMPMDFTETADFVYLRFHGLEAGAAHDYSDDELEPWAAQLNKVAKAGRPAFVYFNNDWNIRAPLNARTLMDMVSPFAVQPFAEQDDSPPRNRRVRTRTAAQVTEPRSKRR
jgi:uncharacterized protein YecE (DUF72 family)